MGILVRDLLRPVTILCSQLAFLGAPFSNLPCGDTTSVVGAYNESSVDVTARHPFQGFAHCPARPPTVAIGRRAG